MERTISFENNDNLIKFSDLDSDKEIEIEVMTPDDDSNFWLDKKNIIELKEHLEYLISKF